MSKAPSWLKSFATAKKKPKLSADGDAAAQRAGEGGNEGAGGGAAQGGEAGGESATQWGADYMSDALLPEPPAPGKVMEEQRAAEEAGRPKSKKRILAEALEGGLSQKLGEDNVGFKMLSKMGFKEGEGGLGRGRDGAVDPLAVNIKLGRAGLGVDEGKHRARREYKQFKDALQTNEAALRGTFQQRQRAAFLAKQAARDLQKAQRVCEQLDRAQGAEHSALWGRPEGPDGDKSKGEVRCFTAPDGQTYYKMVGSSDPAPGEVEEEVVKSAEEMLQDFHALVRHLREVHCFCFGCSGRFSTEEALEGHCEDDEECMSLLVDSQPAAVDDPQRIDLDNV